MKPASDKRDGTDGLAFNWTKVELKLSEIEKIIETQQSFNWTKVELKLEENTLVKVK